MIHLSPLASNGTHALVFAAPSFTSQGQFFLAGS